MNKIISVSIWGDNPSYGKGAVINAKISADMFPDWKYRVYFGSSVPSIYHDELSALSNVDIVEVDESIWGYGMFWRFNAAFESSNTIMLSRDSDTRLIEREKRCVDEWLASDKSFSIIRDHPRHFDFPILGGMWGIKGMLPYECFESMKRMEREFSYAKDQFWLANEVYPRIKDDCLVHQLGKNDWFSIKRDQTDPIFIGQGYDENSKPIYPSWS